ncbi:hypothetical protein GCM10010524_46110 [Streptomyces mexicanus]
MPHPHEKGPVGGAAQPHCCRLRVDRRVRHVVWEFLTPAQAITRLPPRTSCRAVRVRAVGRAQVSRLPAPRTLWRHLHRTWGRGKEKNESPRASGKPTYADRDFGPLDERGTIPDGGRP